MFRGFIAIDIEANPKIMQFEEDIKRCKADVKLVEPENFHITLKFLGNVEEDKIEEIEGIMRECFANIEPFKVTLKGTGIFPNQRKLRVIWIGIIDNIKEIAERLNERLSRLGFKKDVFSSHLTVARVKSSKNKESLLKVVKEYANTEFGVQEVKCIRLKKSELTSRGPIYTCVREVKLGD
jgi:2'-5' RNA ligase